MTRIGWIGTGALGSAIVGRLLDDGAEVVVYNRTTAKARALCSKGAQLASSAREVMETSEVTFVCLSGEEAAERVLLDPVNGVVAAMHPRRQYAKPRFRHFVTPSPPL